MRLATVVSAIALLSLPSIAEAQNYHRHHGYHPAPRHYTPPRHHRPHHHHHHHKRWNNDALAVGIGLGLLGGLIGGSIIHSPPAYGHPQYNYNRPCYREVIGYDPVTGHTIARTICP